MHNAQPQKTRTACAPDGSCVAGRQQTAGADSRSRQQAAGFKCSIYTSVRVLLYIHTKKKKKHRRKSSITAMQTSRAVRDAQKSNGAWHGSCTDSRVLEIQITTQGRQLQWEPQLTAVIATMLTVENAWKMKISYLESIAKSKYSHVCIEKMQSDWKCQSYTHRIQLRYQPALQLATGISQSCLIGNSRATDLHIYRGNAFRLSALQLVTVHPVEIIDFLHISLNDLSCYNRSCCRRVEACHILYNCC